MSKPINESKEICPLMKSRLELVCHKCSWYRHVRGQNPQTGQEMDLWDCSIAMLPILMIETGRQMHDNNAALISLRNEFVAGNDKRIATDVLRTQALIRASQHDN